MKVVQINAVCGYGSTGRICINLNDALTAAGHECTILYGNGTSDYPHSHSVSNKLLVKLNALRSRIFGYDIGGCFLSTRRIIRFLKENKPDIVHLHNIHAHYVNLKLLCRYLTENNIATILTLHDCWPFTGKCAYYSVVGCEKWKSKCQNCPQSKKYFPSYFFDNCEKSRTEKMKLFLSIPRLTIVGCSKWISEEARKSFLGEKKIVTIYNGINIHNFHKRESNLKNELGLKEKQVILGFANKWLQPYNKSVLIELARIIENNQKIVLLGCSSSELHDLPQQVLGLPYISDSKKLSELYSIADIVLNPSHEDNLPTVNLEAQACGVPVIALNLTGLPETVDCNTGLILKSHTPTSWLEGIKSILGKQKTSSPRDFVEDNFSISSFTDSYIDVYQNLLNN